MYLIKAILLTTIVSFSGVAFAEEGDNSDNATVGDL